MLLGVTVYDLVLAVHITAVLSAFGALFAYPIFLAVNAISPIEQRASLHRLQVAFSKYLTGPMIGVVLLAGVYLATDAHLWSQAWVQIGFGLLLVIAGLGATVLRKGEMRLIAASEASDEAAYSATLATVTAWTYVTLALIVLTIFVMAAKPLA